MRDANVAPLPAVLSVLDHLNSMASLFQSPGGIFTSHTVARAALDIAIGPWYLLEPRIGGRERVRRYMNVRLQGLKEQSLLDQSGRTRIREHSEGRIAEILRAAEVHGFEVRRIKDTYKPPFLGTATPTTTSLASEIVSGQNPSLGRLFWKMGSAIAHGQQHGFALFLEGADQVVVDAATGDVAMRMQATAKDTALRCGGAPLAAIAMLRRLYAQYGWDTGKLEAAIAEVISTWQRIADVQQPRLPDTLRP